MKDYELLSQFEQINRDLKEFANFVNITTDILSRQSETIESLLNAVIVLSNRIKTLENERN